jgi:hypothetical protein
VRHRIVSGTFGIGNAEPELLNNKGEINKEFADEAIAIYFHEEEGFDFQIGEDYVMIGIEPSYQYDELKIIKIHKDKSKSFLQRGKAWGPYGTQIAKNTNIYGEYKNKGKFVKFVDKWHATLFGDSNG